MKIVILALYLAAAGILLQAAQDAPFQGPCRDASGKDIKCADGHYHAPNGSIQPDTCNDNYLGADGKPQDDSKKCKCLIATTDADHCPPGGIAHNYQGMGPDCDVSCREQDCKCVLKCDMNDMGGKKK